MKRLKTLLLCVLLFFSVNYCVDAAKVKIVTFKDSKLEKQIRAELNKSKGPITISDMQKIKELSNLDGVNNLEGLQYASNLQRIMIYNSNISSLAPLKNLKKLNELYIFQSKKSIIKDIDIILPSLNSLKSLALHNIVVKSSTLSKLTNLELYSLYNNNLTDINFIKSNRNKNLKGFYISENLVRDFSSLKDKNILNMYIGKNNVIDQNTIKDLRVNASFEISDCNIDLFATPKSQVISISNVKSVNITKQNETINEMKIEKTPNINIASIFSNSLKNGGLLTVDNLNSVKGYDKIPKLNKRVNIFIPYCSTNELNSAIKMTNLMLDSNQEKIGIYCINEMSNNQILWGNIDKVEYEKLFRLVGGIKNPNNLNLVIENIFELYYAIEPSFRVYKSEEDLYLDPEGKNIDQYLYVDNNFNVIKNRGINYELTNFDKNFLSTKTIIEDGSEKVRIVKYYTPNFEYYICQVYDTEGGINGYIVIKADDVMEK